MCSKFTVDFSNLHAQNLNSGRNERRYTLEREWSKTTVAKLAFFMLMHSDYCTSYKEVNQSELMVIEGSGESCKFDDLWVRTDEGQMLHHGISYGLRPDELTTVSVKLP